MTYRPETRSRLRRRLSYYDGLRSERLPAARIEGQSAFFGAHTHERTDKPGVSPTPCGPPTAPRSRGPRNNFPLVGSPRCLFIAGGIDITPILPMIRAAERAGADWRLIYGGRTRALWPSWTNSPNTATG